MDILKEEKLLYVINHALGRGGERIEVFKVDCDAGDIPVGLRYKHSIFSDELNKVAYGNLNSIAVIETNKFYVTKSFENPKPPVGSSIPKEYFILR